MVPAYLFKNWRAEDLVLLGDTHVVGFDFHVAILSSLPSPPSSARAPSFPVIMLYLKKKRRIITLSGTDPEGLKARNKRARKTMINVYLMYSRVYCGLSFALGATIGQVKKSFRKTK
jgi:hypothetical protein